MSSKRYNSKNLRPRQVSSNYKHRISLNEDHKDLTTEPKRYSSDKTFSDKFKHRQTHLHMKLKDKITHFKGKYHSRSSSYKRIRVTRDKQDVIEPLYHYERNETKVAKNNQNSTTTANHGHGKTHFGETKHDKNVAATIKSPNRSAASPYGKWAAEYL